jgi:hypothetical protein
MVVMSANSTVPRIAPAGTGMTSYPPNAKIRSRPVDERSASEGD